MEYKYKGPNKIRKAINNFAELILISYIALGSYSNMYKTGHPSADIKMGISQPSELEQILINSVK